MYTLIYVDIFWQWPSCWCRWWLVFGHSVDFWSSQPLLIQFKTSRTAADWTKHTPYNPIYQILLFQTSPIIQKNILRFKSDALQQFINLQSCSFLAFDEELHGYPIDPSSASLHQHHTTTQPHRACASANGTGRAIPPRTGLCREGQTLGKTSEACCWKGITICPGVER